MISFLFPFRPDRSGHREAIFDYVHHRIQCFIEQRNWHAEILIGDDEDASFNRSKVRNRLAQEAGNGVLVFNDADSIVSVSNLLTAINIALASQYGWVLPYDQYVCLTEAASIDQIKQPDLLDDPEYEYVCPTFPEIDPAISGCIVIRKDVFIAAGGYDERFEGWGEEDRAFYLQMEAVIGKVTRVPGRLHHLWHPAPESERFEQPFFGYNRNLCNRYRQAAGNRQMMESILAEPGRSTVTSA